MNTQKIVIEVSTAEIVKGSWIAFAQVGGVIGKSQRCDDGVVAASEAVKNLVLVADIELGIALSMQGATTETILQELTQNTGSNEPDSIT